MNVRWLPFLALCVLAAGCATSPQPHYRDIEARLSDRGFTSLPRSATDPSRGASAGRVGTAMSVDDVVAATLENNETLRAQLSRVGVSTGELLAAGTVSNPTAEVMTFFPAAGDRPFSLEVGVLQELNDFVIRRHRRNVAHAQLERTKLSVAESILSLSAQARAAAYDYLAARAVLELRTQSKDAAGSSSEIAEELRAAGNISQLDMMRRQAAREEAVLAERVAAQRLLGARERVTRLMSLSADAASTWEIKGALPELPKPVTGTSDAFEEQTASASLQLEDGRLALQAATARRGAARASAWPHLALGVFAEIEPREGTVGVGPALELELPILRFGRGDIAAADAELVAVRHDNAQREVEVRSAARGARATLVQAAQRARLLQDVLLPLRREVTRETLKHYNGMYIGVFELLQAKRDEIETNVMWIEAVRDYWTARAQVDLAVAGGMPASMPVPTMSSPGAPSGAESH